MIITLGQKLMGQPLPLSLSDLQELSLVPLKEGELVRLIQEESRAFTVDRKNIHQYVEDEKKVSAYALFYLPTNMPKLYFLLEQVEKLHGDQVFKSFFQKTFIDVGTGPGTFSLALLFYLKNRGYSFPAIHLIDQSNLMLKQAEKILVHFFPDIKLSMSTHERVIEKDKNYIMFFGHSLNELSDEVSARYVELIRANKNITDVVWIEPGTPSFFAKQLNLRKQLCAENFSILYPCSKSSSCPLEGKQQSEKPEWCHQILRLTHHAEVERVSQLMSLDRKILPMCSMYFSRQNLLKKTDWFFPLKFLNETKFSFDYLFCGNFEDQGLSHKKGEIPKKLISKKAIKILKDRSLGYPLKKENETFKHVSDFFRITDEALLENHINQDEAE